jgi:hypothetical protein
MTSRPSSAPFRSFEDVQERKYRVIVEDSTSTHNFFKTAQTKLCLVMYTGVKWMEIPAQWGCTTGNAATVVHSTKTTTSGKDSVIEGQPLLLFM